MSTTIAPKEAPENTEIGLELAAQIDIPEDKKNEILDWITEEIEKAKGERTAFERELAEYEKLYEAIPDQKVRTEPWTGACNLVVPVIATTVDAVLARMLNAVFGGPDLWIGMPKAPGWVDLAEPLGRWMNWVGKDVMGMYQVCQSWFLGCIKTGTGVLKLPWERRLRNVMYQDADGLKQETILLHDGPLPVNVPLSDFFFSNDAVTTKSIQNCEWIGHRTSMTKKQLKEAEASQKFMDVDKILDFKRTSADLVEEQIEENTKMEVSQRNDYEIWEIWASYDVDGDGVLEEIVFTLNLDARVALSAVYNFYRHQERPFHLIRYMPRDNALLGIGICQMLKDIQEEITTIHRQRIDNGTIANTRAWKRRKGVVLGSEEIYPGAFLDVDEMDDISELKLGDIYPSQLAEELHSNAIGEKRTGISDYSHGRESAAIGSHATATSTLALIQEGNKRFLMTIKDIREALGDIAHQVIMLYQQFAPDSTVMYELFSEKEKRIVQEYFKLPQDLSRASVLIDVPALSETANKDILRQSYMMLMQMAQQVYGGLFQAFQIILAPQTPDPMKELALHGAKTGSKLWERVLESFDFKDADTFSPDVEVMLGLAAGLEMTNGGIGGQTGAQSQGAAGPGGPAGVGLESLMAAAGAGAGPPEGNGGAVPTGPAQEGAGFPSAF